MRTEIGCENKKYMVIYYIEMVGIIDSLRRCAAETENVRNYAGRMFVGDEWDDAVAGKMADGSDDAFER